MTIPFATLFRQAHARAQSAGRVAATLRNQPSWLIKLASLALLVALAALGLLVLIPAIVLALAVFVIGGGLLLIRALARRLFSGLAGLMPAGRARDDAGRRNVRVIIR